MYMAVLSMSRNFQSRIISQISRRKLPQEDIFLPRRSQLTKEGHSGELYINLKQVSLQVPTATANSAFGNSWESS
jgi:hypothetical protein